MKENNTSWAQSGEPSGKAPASHQRRATLPYEHWKRRAYIAWAIVGIGLVFLGTMYVAGVIWQAIAATVVAILVTFLFHAPVNKMETRGIPRVIGSTLCMLALIAFGGLILVSVIPATTSELGNLAAAFPDYVEQAREFAEAAKMYGVFGMTAEQATAAVDAASKWLTEQGTIMMSNTAAGVLGGVMDFGTSVMIAFIGLICSFWMLADLPKITGEIRALVPESRQDDLDVLSDAFGTAIYGWVKATLICALLTGIISFIAFFILGMPYSVLLGMMSGILYVVPYIGPLLAAVLAGAAGLVISPAVAFIAVIVSVVANNVIANLVAPKLMKNSVNLHPALILIVILIGGAVGGIWGMLLAIPISAALQGVFITYFEARSGRKLASADGALFRESGSALPMSFQRKNGAGSDGEYDEPSPPSR